MVCMQSDCHSDSTEYNCQQNDFKEKILNRIILLKQLHQFDGDMISVLKCEYGELLVYIY